MPARATATSSWRWPRRWPTRWRPSSTEYGRILADKAYVDGVLQDGAARAARLADRLVAKVYRKVGLLQPGR